MAVAGAPLGEEESARQAEFLDLKRALDSARYAGEMKEALPARRRAGAGAERYAAETAAQNEERATRLLRALDLLRAAAAAAAEAEAEAGGEGGGNSRASPFEGGPSLEALEAKIQAEAKRLYGGTL